MDAPKADFYWAVVGEAKPEPVAVVIENGKRVAYTCGCADPFDIDGADAAIVLIDRYGNVGSPSPLLVPPTPKEQAEAAERREKQIQADRKRGITHGHRRFNP